jgi:hypothetical protein
LTGATTSASARLNQGDFIARNHLIVRVSLQEVRHCFQALFRIYGGRPSSRWLIP